MFQYFPSQSPKGEGPYYLIVYDLIGRTVFLKTSVWFIYSVDTSQ